MQILKFGGSSVANPERIRACGRVLAHKRQTPGHRALVVCSALGGITDALSHAGRLAQLGDGAYRDVARDIRDRHIQCSLDLLATETYASIESELKERLSHLDDLLYGIFLLREASSRTLDELMGLGERLSVPILWGHFLDLGFHPQRLDALELMPTDDRYGNAKLDVAEAKTHFESVDFGQGNLFLMEGFIGRSPNGTPTTLGRGGSDLSAAYAACFLGAEVLEKWTDVAGMMTADPRLVPSARVIPELSYAEAMELCHFGAKVVFPPTVAQLSKQDIPMHVRLTDDPVCEGTLILSPAKKSDAPIANHGVAGLSSLKNITLITVSGGGMVGIPGISRRLFTALSAAEVNVVLVSQGSSEHAISIAVADQDADISQNALNAEFGSDQELGRIDALTVESGFTIVSLVGDGMRQQSGISGRAFGTLGRNGVSIRSISQGSTERNISIVIDAKHERKALQSLHQAFFETEVKRLHIFCLGVGNVGGTMVDQLLAQREELRDVRRLDLRVMGMANSRMMLLSESGIAGDWRHQLSQSNAPSSPEALVQAIVDMDLENSVLVDNTASTDASDVYEQALAHSIAVVASNKIAASDAQARYAGLKSLALRMGVEYRFETNVGAGLPLIDTIQHLVQSGDRIHKIEGMFSGTLNYVFSNFNDGITFKKVIEDARAAGLTEPDPRTDLSGVDVQRKILILAREAGYTLEMSDVAGKGFLLDSQMEGSIDSFMDGLPQIEEAMQKKWKEADAKGERLKYVGSFDAKTGQASTGLTTVPADHPFFNIEGTDNIVLLTTDRYADRPLIIQGAGAGADVTAMGVFGDLIRIAASR
jgi:aspartokinase/homoserine dehydrogenase 1